MGQGLPALRQQNPNTDAGETTCDLKVQPVLSQTKKSGDLRQAAPWNAPTEGVTLKMGGLWFRYGGSGLPGTCSDSEY